MADFTEVTELLEAALFKKEIVDRQLLAASRSNMVADRTELKEKYVQNAELDTRYFAFLSRHVCHQD